MRGQPGHRGAAKRHRNTVRNLRLEALESRALLATFTVTNAGDLTPTGSVIPGSFRDMINQSNATPGQDTIRFNIGGGGVHRIAPTQALPTITDVVTIDGTTQPGYKTTPLIELDGTNAGSNVNGLILNSATVIKALNLHDFTGYGIRVASSGNTIQQCFIGTNPSGTAAQPNRGGGLVIDAASNNLIGGGAGEGNLISGNSGSGIDLRGSNTSGNRIFGNLIGVDITGGRALRNSEGIDVFGGSFNTIGGLQPDQRNVISGNTFEGVYLFVTNFNTVQNNYIGTDMTGSVAIPNGGFAGVTVQGGRNNQIGGLSPTSMNLLSGNSGGGLQIFGGNQNSVLGNFIGTDSTGLLSVGNLGAGITVSGNGNSIGGTTQGAGNTIAFNGGIFNQAGVSVGSGTGNAILSNSIFNNLGLGIALGNSGNPLPNDPGDADFGANNQQNYPVLTVAATGAGRTLIQGTFNSTANTQYLIQFFDNKVADPSGNGQGRVLIGSTTVTTDANGDASINVTFASPVTVSDFISATATDPNGNTSEFSNSQLVVPGAITDLALSMTAAPTPATLNGTIVYTLKVRNDGPDPATGVTVTDVLPTGVTYVSSTVDSGGTVGQAGANVVATFPILPVGVTATITITVTPNQTGLLTNQATLVGTDIDPNLSNNTASLTTQVVIPADLGVTILAGPTPATVGTNLVYQVVVNNNGPGAATGVTVDIVLPQDVQLVDATSGSGSVTEIGTNLLRASLGTLPAGIPGVVRITVQPTLVGTTTITASVTANEVEPPRPPGTPDPTPTTATLNTVVNAASDLGLTMTAAPDPASSSEVVTYTIIVTNNGPSDATGVVVNDDVPLDLINVQAESTLGTVSVVGNLVKVVIGDLPLDGQATITITGTPVGSGTVTNTATVFSNEVDLNDTNDTASFTSTFNPADLAITVGTSSPFGISGQKLTYTLSVTNTGPAIATGVVLADTLPTGAVFDAADGGVLPVSGQLTFNIGSLAVGDTVIRRFTVIPKAGSFAMTNTAVVTNPDQVDPTSANNTRQDTTLVNPANLGITITTPSSTVLVGDVVPFVVTVTNTGPVDATNVNPVELLPANSDFVSIVANTPGMIVVPPSNGLFGALIPKLAKNASASFTFSLRPKAVGGVTNLIKVKGDQIDPDTTNNTATRAVSAINLPGAVGFSSAGYAVSEKAGSIVIPVTRTGGTLGTLVVNYTVTAGPGAVANVNFVPDAGTLTFADGEFQKTITVKVLNDKTVALPKLVNLALTSTNPAQIGKQSKATLTILEGDYATTGPKVTNVQLQGASSVTGAVLTFGEPMDPVSAQNRVNYAVVTGGVAATVSSAVYDVATQSVRLTFAKGVPTGSFGQLIVNTDAPFGLRGLSGLALDGAGSNVPGSKFLDTFARGTRLSYPDASGNTVSLSLTGPGTLEVIRRTDGEAVRVRVVGGSSASVISGSVTRGPKGTGRAYLGILEGVGVFPGGAQSRLLTPPFYLGNTTPVVVSAKAADSLIGKGGVTVRSVRRGF